MIFSSRTIPGNEKADHEIINALVELGIEVITDRDALVHVSGHPRRDELRKMYALAAAADRRAGARRSRASGRAGALMLALGIGQVAQVARRRHGAACARRRPSIIDEVPFGRLYHDGRLIGPTEAMGIRDRRKLSFAGHVAVDVVLDDKDELAGDPIWCAIGVAEADADGETLEDLMIDAAIDAVELDPPPAPQRPRPGARGRAARGARGRKRSLGQEAAGDGVVTW